jgi:Bacterial protein of unknown function (DUF922)
MKSMLHGLLALIACAAIALPLMSFMPLDTEPTGPTGVDNDEMRWTPGRKLTWADFKGTPAPGNPMDALTESGITFSWACDQRGFRAEIYSLFVPSKSWVKEPTASLLAHEQVHFDITELHARKLRKYFAEMRNPCYLGKDGINAAGRRIIEDSNAMQRLYDAETRHSERVTEQKRWEAQVKAQLDAHAMWAQ